MPPVIALAFCIAFVLFLLWLERKQSPDVTRALWLPTIWMLYVSSKPLGVWFPSSGGNPDAGSPLDRTFLVVIMFIALLILIRRGFDWSSAMKENTWVMVLVVFMLISVLWSNIPSTSFNRWVREFQALLMAFVILSEPSPRQSIESLLRRTTYMLIPFSVLLIKYFPYYGVDYGPWSGVKMWIGVTLHKNNLGRLCIISIFFLIWSLAVRRQGLKNRTWKYESHVEIFILVIAVILILGPGRSPFYSATSIYALIIGLLFFGVFFLFRKSRKRFTATTLMAIITIFIVIGIAIVFVRGSSVNLFASTAGRNSTLTGRTEIWAALLPSVMRHPLMGCGFGGFWTSRTREIFEIGEAHNGYLDVLLGLGFVGLLLTTLFLLSSCRKAQHELALNYEWGTLWICFVIMAVVHNIAESSIDSLANQITAIILFFSISSKSTKSCVQQDHKGI